MPSEAQIAANRRNAQASTGPKTPEGKARAAGNATRLGLFTTLSCVLPRDREEYNQMFRGLWSDLRPQGAVEEMFATEIIRGAWRLRRCAVAEATLPGMLAINHQQEHEERLRHDKNASPGNIHDPVFTDRYQAYQVSIDRARAHANNVIRRAVVELRRLQNDRLIRTATLGQYAESINHGIAAFAEVLPKLNDDARLTLLCNMEAEVANRETEITNRTQSGDTRLAAASFPPCTAPDESEITKQTQSEPAAPVPEPPAVAATPEITNQTQSAAPPAPVSTASPGPADSPTAPSPLRRAA